MIENKSKNKSIESVDEVAAWIRQKNAEVEVSVDPIAFKDLKGWEFDLRTGNLVHQSGHFFSIVGLDVYTNSGTVSRWMQPIINQPEVGYLGIICKMIRGEMHYLLQAKIEPGNVNCVQLSPTLQATRSNYMQVHGGMKPAYLDYFRFARSDQIVLDQLQSEQGARFYRKRNRNMIIRVDEDVPVIDNFMWLTYGQIKDLMRMDNTVNMDTRTVLSGLDLECCAFEPSGVLSVREILHRLSELKCRYELVAEKIPLKDVKGWMVTDTEIVRPDRNFFRVIGVNVTISNREVSKWCQPLVEPMQEGLCVLFCKRINDVMHYLLQAKVECGNYDVVELAPTIQCLTGSYRHPVGYTPAFLDEFLAGTLPGRIVVDVKQSEEGGRFYHEQNRNVIFELDEGVDLQEDEKFMWLSLSQIKAFLWYNNYLNIQVRSLVALI